MLVKTSFNVYVSLLIYKEVYIFKKIKKRLSLGLFHIFNLEAFFVKINLQAY